MPDPRAPERVGDIDEFRVRVAGELSPFRILTADPGPFQGAVRTGAIGDIRLTRIRQNSAMTVEILEDIDYFDVILAQHGSARIATAAGAVAVGGDVGIVISPSMRAAIDLSADYEQVHLRIDPRALRLQAEALLGREVPQRLRFVDSELTLSSPQLAAWRGIVLALATDPTGSATFAANPIVAKGLQDSILAGLLSAQPHNLSAYSNGPARSCPSARCARLRPTSKSTWPNRFRSATSLAPPG